MRCFKNPFKVTVYCNNLNTHAKHCFGIYLRHLSSVTVILLLLLLFYLILNVLDNNECLFELMSPLTETI